MENAHDVRIQAVQHLPRQVESILSSVDAFPQTTFLQQTDSLGVVTGQPATASIVVSAPEEPGISSIASEISSIVLVTPSLSSIGDRSLSPTSSTPTSTNASTSTTSATSAIASNHEHSTNIGAIVGGVLGGLAIIGVVVVALYWIRRKHPKATSSDHHPEAATGAPPRYADADLPEVAQMQHGQAGYQPQELDGRWNQISEMATVKK